MNKLKTLPDVLTLEEAARYLRLPRETVKQQAAQGKLPGRFVDGKWRFLKAALNDWLRVQEVQDSWTALLEQAGAFKDDETLPEMLKAIYQARGRPEVEEGSNG
jgi:excisionase family DNA binding protein